MSAFDHKDSIKEDIMMEAQSEKNEQPYSGNTDNSLVKRYNLKASLTHKRIRYICKECGKQLTTQRCLNVHKRAVHEGLKHPCG